MDIHVTQDGRPVSNLTASDFRILENGAPQQVATFGPIPTAFDAMRAQAMALHALGRLEDAEHWFREALATLQRERPRRGGYHARLRGEYGLPLLDRGDVTGSEALIREAFAATWEIRPEGHPGAVRPALALAKWHMRTRKFEEAERLSIEGDRQLAALYGVSHPLRIKVLDQIVKLYVAWGPARGGRAVPA